MIEVFESALPTMFTSVNARTFSSHLYVEDLILVHATTLGAPGL